MDGKRQTARVEDGSGNDSEGMLSA